MSGKIKLQHLKALERAPQGTLAFRFYLLKGMRSYPIIKLLVVLSRIPFPSQSSAASPGFGVGMEQICYIWNNADTSGLYCIGRGES